MITRMWNRLPFSLKTGSLVFLLISFVVLSAARYHVLIENLSHLAVEQTTDVMLKAYQRELKDIVDVMANSLASAIDGVTNEESIYQTFTQLIDTARFFPDKSGYYFIYKSGGIVFVHGTQKHLENINLNHLRDPNGTLLIQELEKVAQDGGGYVEYWWKKPGHGLQPKLSYARMIPTTNYWIGTGVYIDDIEQQKTEILNEMNHTTISVLRSLYMVLVAGFFIVVLPMTVVLIKSIVVPVRELTTLADRYSLGKLDLTIPYTDRHDEIGKMAKALERLGNSVKVALKRLKQ